MRYAVLSDIHANAEALRAVFQDMQTVSREQGAAIDQIWCLGDIVGYGPEPGECTQFVRTRCDVVIPGNHDWAAIGKIDLNDFSHSAASAALWTRDRIKVNDRNYLRALPELTHVGDFTLVHGSPTNPIWEYLTTPSAAAPNFAAFDTTFCMVGHSHVPIIFLQKEGAQTQPPPPGSRADRALQSRGILSMAIPGGPSLSLSEDDTSATQSYPDCFRLLPAPGLWMLPPGYRAIINPGSVGQPRDGNPMASYVIYDSKVGFEFRRVQYDVATTQHKIRQAGLSPQLADRLARGD